MSRKSLVSVLLEFDSDDALYCVETDLNVAVDVVVRRRRWWTSDGVDRQLIRILFFFVVALLVYFERYNGAATWRIELN